MAINTVTATINGNTYTLNLDQTTGKYKATITAPGATSYHQPGGYYNVSVAATNDAGTTGTADGSALTGLRLVVKERVKPVITIINPSSGARVSSNRPTITGTVTDEPGGSGVNSGTIILKVDGASVPIIVSAITNGYSFSATPASALSDGQHTITVNASDRDGNAATTATATITVDTVPPSLSVASPSNNMVTASASINVSGTTNDATSSPVTIDISVNGVDAGNVSVTGGSFTKTVTLRDGSNTITVTATDAAGQTTTVTRTVTLNTSSINISAASISPNPADAGATVIITVTVTEA